MFVIAYPVPEIWDEVPENFQGDRIFETRITRMVTNLVTLKSIDEGQIRAGSSSAADPGCVKALVPAEALKSWSRRFCPTKPHEMTPKFTGNCNCRCLKGFAFFGVFRGQEDYPQPILDALKRYKSYNGVWTFSVVTL